MSKVFSELKTARQQREFYKAWIRSKPCCWCGAAYQVGCITTNLMSPVQASHHNFTTQGPSGTGRKSADYRVVPLCAECHTRLHQTGRLYSSAETPLAETETASFLQRATIDLLVEFLETVLNPEVL